MSEGTPDRLKEFRAQYGQKGRSGGTLAVAQLAVICVGFVVILVLLFHMMGQKPTVTLTTGLAPEKQKALAVYLTEKNDPASAIGAYEDYLKTAQLEPVERAKICYSVAKLAVDSEKYEKALPYLYEAEFLDPKSDLKDEINKKVIVCLEKLKRNVDLRHELRQRSDVKKKTSADVKQDETVLAEVMGEVITDRDLDKEIEKLPQSVRDTFNKEGKKGDLLKNLVAQRLLLDKAKRQELDKTPEIQDQLAKELDGLIVNKLISDEVKKDVKVTPEDVERFYKAEPDKFKEPASAEVILAKADTADAAKAITEFKDKPITVVNGRPVPGAPEKLDETVVFTVEPGAIAGPVEADNAWYVFKVLSKKPERLPPFEDVKDQAARMFQMQKEQEKFQSLINETLQAQDVHLYLNRIKESEAKK